MHSLRSSFLLAAALVCATAHARQLDFKEAPCSATGDGRTDDRPALGRAFAAAKPGDVIFVPAGRYRITLTGGAMSIPAGVTLRGEEGATTFALDSNGNAADYREFLRPRSEVVIEGLAVERAATSGILFPVSGDTSNIVIRNCRIAGAQERFPQSDCHAFRVGYGTVRHLWLDRLTVEDCCYGLFQPNEAAGTLTDVLVERCRFARNTATDLEFNAPRGTMRNIVVRDCTFRDNRGASAAGGFAVGFANVQGGSVESCTIRNYGSEALHVEDRSSDIRLAENTIMAASTRQPNGIIMVLSGSRRVEIVRNFVDARTNTNRVHLILVTGGGKNFACPAEVSVIDNVLVNGPQTRPWYLQEGAGPAPAGNVRSP